MFYFAIEIRDNKYYNLISIYYIICIYLFFSFVQFIHPTPFNYTYIYILLYIGRIEPINYINYSI